LMLVLRVLLLCNHRFNGRRQCIVAMTYVMGKA
jgi:hypothetical protein